VTTPPALASGFSQQHPLVLTLALAPSRPARVLTLVYRLCAVRLLIPTWRVDGDPVLTQQHHRFPGGLTRRHRVRCVVLNKDSLKNWRLGNSTAN